METHLNVNSSTWPQSPFINTRIEIERIVTEIEDIVSTMTANFVVDKTV